MNLPMEVNELFFGGDFNTATAENAVNYTMHTLKQILNEKRT